jgi:predicted N-acetyltransferase YhbS
VSTKSYEYARLDAFPELTDQTNSLIEEAFAYQKNFKFSVDFAPLAGPQHAHQRHILIDPASSTVVAHVGTRLKNFVWQGETIPVVMLGGIAVSEAERGQGLFQLLFERVLSTLHSQCALFILWSDKHEMYRKWHFHLAGKQWCYRTTVPEKVHSIERLIDLTTQERDSLAALYRQHVNQHCFSPLRDASDWNDLAEITSTELIRMKSGYAFRGKGMDLQGVLHDFAHSEGVTGVAEELGNAGVIWAAKNESVPDEVLQDLQQVGLWRPNTHPMALRKLSLLLGLELNYRDDRFVVERNGVALRMDAEELLDEIFNYGKHGLRSDSVPVYIGGLDSI